jgi:hypothetical protein
MSKVVSVYGLRERSVQPKAMKRAQACRRRLIVTSKESIIQGHNVDCLHRIELEKIENLSTLARLIAWRKHLTEAASTIGMY